MSITKMICQLMNWQKRIMRIIDPRDPDYRPEERTAEELAELLDDITKDNRKETALERETMATEEVF